MSELLLEVAIQLEPFSHRVIYNLVLKPLKAWVRGNDYRKFPGLNFRGPKLIREIRENYAPRKYGAIRYEEEVAIWLLLTS